MTDAKAVSSKRSSAGPGRAALSLLCLFLLGALFPAAASASFPWTDQAALQNETDPALRATYIVDGGAGSVISRSLFLSHPYIDFYESHGFDRNFFTWAPHASVGDAYMSGKGWTGCASVQIAVAGKPSYCGAVKYGAPGSIRADVLHGDLTGYKWGETFMSEICGNWAPANSAAKTPPMPTVSGVKYEDLNADGKRESGEPGLAGWTIQLFYGGTHVATTTTGADGAYSFRLNADTMPIGGGTYTVKEVQKEGWHQAESPAAISVPAGAGDHVYGGNDFGNWRPATISGHKFDDSNVDGAWGEGESPLGEWGIDLSNGEELSTGVDGSYSFSVKPGTYTVGEQARSGWRQTAPGSGSFEYTVTSGQLVKGADFGNVCLGGVSVEALDDSTGEPLSGMKVRLEEISVPGILENEPALPLTASGVPDFGGLLPGTYEVTAFLPEGEFTTDPDAVLVEGRFALVKQVTVSECETTEVPLHVFTESTPGKVTGGTIQIALPSKFATSGFNFMTRGGEPHGVLQYNDHGTGAKLHTSDIEAIWIEGETAWIWGSVEFEGVRQRFRLRLVDAGEPGVDDRFELTLEGGYEAGFGETIEGGNVQIH